MALIALAEEAQDIAAGFNKFLEPVPEISTEITGLISECYAISSALRELNTAKEDPRYAYDYDYVSRDVLIARQSLKYTFHDVFRLFGGLGRPSYISNRTAYYQVWRDIEDHFYQEASSEYKYQELQDRTMALLGKQELRLEAAFNNLSLGEAVMELLMKDGAELTEAIARRQSTKIVRAKEAARTFHPSSRGASNSARRKKTGPNVPSIASRLRPRLSVGSPGAGSAQFAHDHDDLLHPILHRKRVPRSLASHCVCAKPAHDAVPSNG
ncbi:MAG: hypothetical protein Q9197_005699 [Variospora fuerteventurae]